MLLYHFTCREHWEIIENEGLSKGEAPISTERWENAVNLTTDKSPIGHGLSSGQPLSPEFIELAKRKYGREPTNTHWPDKTAVRIKVKIPSRDPKLKKWTKWAGKRADRSFLEELYEAAGGLGKHKTWWLYFGTIPPVDFVEVDFLKNA